MRKLLLFLLCIGMVSCAKSRNDMRSAPEQTMENRKTAELSLELLQASSTPTEFSLKVVNRGHQPITIDRRLLNPVTLTQLRDGSNKSVAKVPPSVPHAAEKSDMIDIQPGRTFALSFSIAEITMEDLNTPPYTIQCCYDAEGGGYPPGWNVWRGKVYSNAVRFSGKATESK